MILSTLAHIFTALLELIRISRLADHDKYLEILILRYQLDIAQHKLTRTIKPSKSEKLTLAILVNRLKHRTNRCAGYFTHPLCLRGIVLAINRSYTVGEFN